jgi:hypothetical protein
MLESIHHLRKYLAPPSRPARETKITLGCVSRRRVVRETTTAMQDTYANGEYSDEN